MFQLEPENCISVVRGTVALHNIMRDRYPQAQNAEMEAPAGAPGSWRNAGVLEDVDRAAGRGPKESKDGKKLRQYLLHYYNSPVGSVPWQEAAIQRGNV
jgi:hypothetical protein